MPNTLLAYPNFFPIDTHDFIAKLLLMHTTKRLCRLCKGPVVGRSDKIFCSLGCKNEYHVRLRQATAQAVRDADKILHRNRSILLEIVGKHKTQQKVHRSVLDKKKFNTLCIKLVGILNEGIFSSIKALRSLVA